MNTVGMRFFSLVLMAALFTAIGCRTLEPEAVPSPGLAIPETFSSSQGNAVAGRDRDWWQSVGNGELDRLIRAALEKNFDIKTLEARVDQARAGLEKETGSTLPALSFTLGGQQNNTRVKTSQSTSHDNSHSWDSSLTGSYTLDAWGEISARVRSKALALAAAEQDLQDKALEVTFDIAETWVDLIATRQKKQILDQQIKSDTTHFELQKMRFINGKASALDVAQQREVMTEALAQAPVLEKDEALLFHTLSFLTGTTPDNRFSIETRVVPDPLPLPPLGFPSDLLENRADIRAAGQRLLSSQWAVHSAKADLLPSLTLSAKALFSSGHLDLLFQNWVASLGAGLAGPLFDGGTRKAEVRRTRALVKEQLSLYSRTVAQAIREVEDNLVRIEKQNAYIQRLDQELAARGLTLKDAWIQYFNGQSSFLNYLTALIGIQRLERQLVSERALYFKERIRLYKVLGWKSSVKLQTGASPVQDTNSE